MYVQSKSRYTIRRKSATHQSRLANAEQHQRATREPGRFACLLLAMVVTKAGFGATRNACAKKKIVGRQHKTHTHTQHITRFFVGQFEIPSILLCTQYTSYTNEGNNVQVKHVVK